MQHYQSPGVYVEEVASAIQTIAGVGTSTAGFYGTVPDVIYIPNERLAEKYIASTPSTPTTPPTTYDLPDSPVITVPGTFQIWVNGTLDTDATLSNVSTPSTVTLSATPPNDADITGSYVTATSFSPVAVNEPKLCTNFSEFKSFFGEFSVDEGQRNLAHAVFGFFQNGGTRCYVIRNTDAANLRDSLEVFEA